MVRLSLAGIFVLMSAACTSVAEEPSSPAPDPLPPEAETTLHDDLLTLDAHLDTPA